MIDPSTLQLSAMRALWGNVPASLRMASIDSTTSVITWLCVFDENASDDDFELLRTAGAEIVSDFPEVTKIDEDFRKIPLSQKPERLTYLIFSRSERF